ncbi:anaerobic ribonucleoside-triphosphate reductase activating protein [Agathobaculum sp.]|uniref:anaerobic ribonucleoside-triphosphate reductase activating protein n=1 Tax=Agathobaculum sp. TaxID=2048138 RepID=UPI002A8263BC|nr:anaerobic ribonucleoside-triphosphate reductase activating protein [Agathobaculum sp.]MDY3617970.1 anaerobic ribonucleoside-triphosphate reductase activating protein [Agathobaculum sp.]
MRYHNITKNDMLNGEGLRAVLWVSGCSHACPGCHNPITWDEQGGIPFDQAAKDELFAELNKDYLSGVTFSGGDPLYPANRDEITALCREIKNSYPDKTIWLYTGYTWNEVCGLPVVEWLDVLVDGRFVQAIADPQLHWRGSENQRVIDVRRTRELGQIVLLDGVQ